MPSRLGGGAILYWSGAVLLTVFGFLGLFSIGAPFFLTGVAMLAVGRWRHRPEALWPTLVGVWAFVVGYILVAPLVCTGTAVPVLKGQPQRLGHTTCTNVLGIDYSGTGIYNPALAPALLAGLAMGVLGAYMTRRLLTRRTPRMDVPDRPDRANRRVTPR